MYQICLRQLRLGRMTAERLEQYFRRGRLTKEEYEALMARLEGGEDA